MCVRNRPVCVADVHDHDAKDPAADSSNSEQHLAQRAKATGRNRRHRLAMHAMQGLVSSEVLVRGSWSRVGEEGLPFDPCEADYGTAYLNREVRGA